MDKKAVEKALIQVLEEGKGKRKFTQATEFIVNFTGVNFKKPENRLNLDIILPKGRGKDIGIVVFAENPQIKLDAKNAGAVVKEPADIAKMAKERKKLKLLAKHNEFLAEPKLMVEVGKHLGRVLGTMGKLPKPIIGAAKPQIELARKRTRISTKGKYLPVVQCAIGSEEMSANDLAENAETVYEKIRAKINEQNIKSIYVKLTMGKAVKVE